MQEINRFSRMQALFGEENMEKLKNSHVAVFGVGGVGGYAAEALARSGVGTIEIIDNDVVSLTNINRQIIALSSTVGKNKVDVMKERLLDINPDCHVIARKVFFLPETANEFDFSKYDYVVDAVDTVTAKLSIILEATRYHIPVISSMGTGNKCNPAELKVADIYQTKVDPLAKVMRAELKKRNVKKCKVVYSEESPILPLFPVADQNKRSAPGSTAFVPPWQDFCSRAKSLRISPAFPPSARESNALFHVTQL